MYFTYKKNLSLAPSISETHISIRQYLNDGVFLCDNGDLAITYNISGIHDEILTEDDLVCSFLPINKFIQSVGKGVPAHKENASTIIQIICSQRVITTPPVSMTHLPLSQAGELIHQEEKHLFHTGLIKRSFFLTVRWQRKQRRGIKYEAYRILNAIKSNKEEDFLSELMADKKIFLRELKNKSIESGIKLSPLTSKEVISFYNNVLNHTKSLPYELDEDETSLTVDQIINHRMDGAPNGFNTGSSNIRLFTFLALPNYFALGRMRLFLDHLPCKNYDFSWVVSHGDKATNTDFLLKKMFFSQGPAHQKKFNDLVSFENEADTQNPIFRMSCRLIVHDVDEELESKILSAGVDYLSAPTICEKEIAPHLIMTSLPMNCSKDDHNIIGRFRTVLLKKALMFAPLYTSPSYGNGFRYWIARNAEPIKIDLFNTGGNNHVVILGNSESGKSCLLSQFNIEFMWRFEDGVIRIIDRKTSYRKICDLFHGKVIQFNEAYLRANPYSPFAYKEWDEDDIQNTVVFIQNAIIQLNPEAIVTGLHTEIISEALKLAANDHERNHSYASQTGEVVDPHPTWIDIAKKLPTAAANKGTNQDLTEQALEEIRRWTVSFDSAGQFGFLFCTHEDAYRSTEEARIVVYDLDGIADPRLQIMASQLAFLKIARDLKKIDRKTRKLIIFEELGVLVQGDSPQAGDIATRFIRNVVKTARKIGAQAIGVSNELSDFTETEGGKTFFKVAPQKLFLPQSATTKIEIEEKLAKELTKADIDVIKSLKIVKGFYSQGYLISQNTNFKGSFLIPLSPTMNAIVTTDAKEEFYYDKLRKLGLTVQESIQDMAEHHPYGAGL